MIEQLDPEQDGYRLSTNAPVYEIDDTWFGSDEKYPGVWITERVTDGQGKVLGRTYMMVYPFEDPDEGGAEAMRYGGRYYDEGMGYADPADHRVRIACFQAAELLYLHAAERGNPFAWLCLGYVYSYDRCEGDYFRDLRHAETKEDYTRAYPREQRAFECFDKAASHDLAEGCYKLGDMYRDGIGCTPDVRSAFEEYGRAFELGQRDAPVIWGSAALRLGDSAENGFGCVQSFSRAHKWYEKAATGLEIAVRSGDWYYERALARAHAGIKRTAQELGES